MNFVFVADVQTRTLRACDEWTDARWVPEATGIACPQNVRELIEIALAVR